MSPWQLTEKEFKDLEEVEGEVWTLIKKLQLQGRQLTRILNRASERRRRAEMRKHPERFVAAASYFPPRSGRKG